ncbi:Bromodomain containing protein [Trichomonas vaginalis G3]|uniref:Bromodomain containing protein n=1 Tax=Trichomonas vaginalis (strain ATCC PRA-98 / G3) TaxID=412133 RepID=A2G6V9_TRIV3|nr:Bromodomain containing protein [Trichomonas vaginalis G3]|eukprot:XP_001300029.1 Bromodomain containing protein [Trichomonas vaginalis G3]
MTVNVWELITNFMTIFNEGPLNKAFLNPVDPEKDQLSDYYNIITQPMDLTTVKNKVLNREYKTPDQWYNDMCLIYQNAITYHSSKNNQHWCDIAAFLLKDFKDLASQYNYATLSDWNSIYTAEMKKLGQLLEKSSVAQGIDDFVSGCVKRAEKMQPIPPQDVPIMVKSLETCLEDPEKKRCILAILKKTQKNLTAEKETDTLTINIAELNNNSLNALNLYVRSFT